MPNQTITASTNHDALTGRNAGEDITIQQGAVLTIDSYPQDTTSGILGDLNITSGEIHIDGRRVREVAYDSGTGSLPAVGTSLTYGASGTAKVINLTSGTATSGVITITIQGVFEEPTGTITDGSWSATITSSKIGVLKVFGEDQIWDATDGTCTLRITGDWYDIALGDGTDNQSIALPHTGRQHALWIETGSGTNVFQIWHRVNTTTSTVFFDSVSDWGNSFESGFVFSCVAGSGVVNFGTSTNGGAPPLGARIRMPNVHLGTTTVAAPQTEIISNVLASHISIIDALVTENVFIDHLNASTVDVTLNQTNGATISDSALGISGLSFIINNAAPVTITNCCFRGGQNIGTEGPANVCQILDNLGGITFQDCVIVGGVNGNNGGVLLLTTMANFTFEGANKIVSMEQDENSMATLRCTTSSRVFNNGTLLVLNGSIFATAGSVNLQLGDIAWGQLTARGNTENTLAILNLAATDTVRVNSGRYLTGSGVSPFRGAQISLTDSANVTIQNFGSVTSKLNNGGFGSAVFNLAGITNNVVFRRCYFTNTAASQMITTANSVSGVTFENCGADYNDELEMDSSNFVAKGLHCASGAPEATTGVEGDLINVVGSTFYDHFKSDTTGAIGLVFASPGSLYAGNFQIVSGTPVFNGIGDLIMSTIGDQVIYTWPYEILGHTAFQNIALQLSGVNTGNLLYEYDLDTGSGFSGTYQTINGANLSAETISPTGFRPRIRMTTQATATTSITGFAIRTDTTLAAQAANLYPLEQVLISASVLADSQVQLYNVTTDTEIDNQFVTGTSYSYAVTTEASNNDVIRLRVTKKGYLGAEAVAIFASANLSFLISQVVDEQYVAYGIDGDTVTKFEPDYVNDQVDLSISSNFSGAEFYAWFNANLATEDGISNFFGGATAIDAGNIRINSNIVDLRFDNLTSTNVFQNDNIRIFRTDSAYPVANPTTGGGGIDLVWRNQVFTVSIGGSALTPTESAWLSDINNRTARVDGLVEDVSGDRFTVKALEQAPSGGGGGTAPTEAEMYTYFTSTGRQDAFKADVSGLATQASVNTVDTVVDAIKAKTDTLENTDLTGIATSTNVSDSQTAVIAQINANEAKLDIIDSQVDAIKAKTDVLENADLTLVAKTTELEVVNEGVKRASLFRPHSEDI